MKKLSVPFGVSDYWCNDCGSIIGDGKRVFVVEFVEKRVAKINNRFVLVQVSRPKQFLLCKFCGGVLK